MLDYNTVLDSRISQLLGQSSGSYGPLSFTQSVPWSSEGLNFWIINFTYLTRGPQPNFWLLSSVGIRPRSNFEKLPKVTLQHSKIQLHYNLFTIYSNPSCESQPTASLLFSNWLNNCWSNIQDDLPTVYRPRWKRKAWHQSVRQQGPSQELRRGRSNLPTRKL